jgi:aspartate/methionine/tyrosine aminotransferase
MERKGFTDINQLMDEALTSTNVSFCTRKHFGRPLENEQDHYVRFAYSGIDVDDINEGMARLKAYFEV